MIQRRSQVDGELSEFPKQRRSKTSEHIFDEAYKRAPRLREETDDKAAATRLLPKELSERQRT